jgi:hypothetical protein
MKASNPFKVIKCQGTAYEIGRQYGEACAEHLKFSVQFNLQNSIAMPYGATIDDVISESLKLLPLRNNSIRR